MRTLTRNKWKNLYIGIFCDEEVIYKTDEQGNIVYIDVDGVAVPVEIGKKPSGYEIQEKPIKVNLAESGGEAESVQYGIDTSQYSAKFTVTNKKLPITETTRLWETMPTIDANNRAKASTADWKIVKISESVNNVTYLLDKLAK